MIEKMINDPAMMAKYPSLKHRFAAISGMLLENVTVNFSASRLRTEYVDGVEYAIYPVVILTEGVHHAVNGSPVYYPADLLQRTAEHWHDIPVTVAHPFEGGKFKSVSAPGVRERWAIGLVKNGQYKDGKVGAEAWIYASRADIVQQLDAGSLKEISSGVFINGDGAAGMWNGERYNQKLVSLVPDHLALLPGNKGACSFEDGCGVRVNNG
ncbi:MAG: hypothetical protein BWK76_23105 [Desulfobulbaceae bacterium A2]|nr:MAG: hypothetical protein BWK76_23105 [Desulfobulbaceae bacterium A2]